MIGVIAASLGEGEDGAIAVGGGGGIGGNDCSVEGLSEEYGYANAQDAEVVDEYAQLIGEEAEVVLDGG